MAIAAVEIGTEKLIRNIPGIAREGAEAQNESRKMERNIHHTHACIHQNLSASTHHDTFPMTTIMINTTASA